jgi:hypothetical protein
MEVQWTLEEKIWKQTCTIGTKSGGYSGRIRLFLDLDGKNR